MLERAVILCQGTVLQPAHLGAGRRHTPAADDVCTLEEAERRHILKALEQIGRGAGRPATARPQLLGINRSTLWSRMRKLGIDRRRVQASVGCTGHGC